MRILAWLPVAALVTLLAGCGDIPQAFPDAAGTGSCTPACAATATCTGTTCACNAGYTGDGLTCADDNECTTANGGCDSNATCTNVPGTRTCSCLPGFLGDGVTCRQGWMKVGMTTLRLTGIGGQPNRTMATALGNRIYFAPKIGSDGDVTNHYLRYFDTTTMTFSGPLGLPPAGSSDFCACGYSAVFVADATSIYMFGNDGFRYDPGVDRWATVASYVPPFRRGEAAGAYEASSNLIFMIGGRDSATSETRALRIALPGAMFGDEQGVLPVAMNSARAWAPRGNNITYLAGGDGGTGSHFYSHVTGTDVWTPLPDAPGTLGRAAGMGDFMDMIWVAANDRFFFFQPSSNTWRAQPVMAPAGFVTAVTAPSGTFALVQNGESLEVHKLVNID